MAKLICDLLSALETRFEVPPGFRARQVAEPFATGIAEVDRFLGGGFRRAALSEICGAPSSNRTSLVLAVVARALRAGECCVWIDGGGTFDPASAADAGLPLERLLWINCRGDAAHSLKSADLLIHGGGFGLVVFDLADIASSTLRHIEMHSWFRLRKAAEETGSALIAVTSSPQTRSCSAVHINLSRQKSLWRGKLLHGTLALLETRKRTHLDGVSFETVF